MAVNNSGSGLPNTIRTIVTREPIESDTGGTRTTTVRTEPSGRETRTVVNQTPLGGRMGGSQTETVQTTTGGPETAPVTGNPVTHAAGFLDRHSGDFKPLANVPNGVPKFLGSRQLLFMLWLVALVLVASDEWKMFPWKFPRPSRFWHASVVYGLLFMASQIDSMVPLCNALGIGFVVTLGYENLSGNNVSLFGFPITGSDTGTTPAAPANPPTTPNRGAPASSFNQGIGNRRISNAGQ